MTSITLPFVVTDSTLTPLVDVADADTKVAAPSHFLDGVNVYFPRLPTAKSRCHSFS